MKKDSIAYVVIFTFLVCVAFVLPLAAANELTKDRVEANRLYASRLAVLEAFGLAGAETPRAEVESRYSAAVKELPGGAYEASIEGSVYRAVRQVGAGLWGSITAIVAADASGTRLRGLVILDQAETPGLGGRIVEEWFTSQFRGELVGASGVSVDQAGSGTGDADKENGRVDAVTGATRTSDFVESLVNAGVTAIKALGGAK